MSKKVATFNPFVFIIFFAFGYLVAKDLLGGFDTYEFGFDNENGTVWRANKADGKVSYCSMVDWNRFPDSEPVCTNWSEN